MVINYKAKAVKATTPLSSDQALQINTSDLLKTVLIITDKNCK